MDVFWEILGGLRMNTDRELEIVSLLSDDIYTYSGKVLSDEAYQHPDTVRALYKAKEALGNLKHFENKQEKLTENAGMCWSEEEEKSLVASFDKGTGIKDLAETHKRTEGAIIARLVKLGKIERE